ncbi:MAG: ATP-dependent zinc metalloprotease FtsH [Acidimicrobiales bacterium]
MRKKAQPPSVARAGRRDGAPAPRADKAKKARPGRRRTVLLLATLVALGAGYAAALGFLRPSSPGSEISLNTLVANSTGPKDAEGQPLKDAAGHVVAGRIRSVRLLDQDSRITGELVGPNGKVLRRFWAAYPRSDAATNDLLRVFYGNDVSVTVDAQSAKAVVRFVSQFLLPLVILANLFALVFSLSGGGGSGTSPFLVFGRLGDKRMSRAATEVVTFANVAAAEEAKAELAEIRDYLADPTLFAQMGALPPKGVLLTGPPGCGKTLLARAVAGEANASFYSISGSEFVESLVGVGAARVRDLFRQARASAPSLIFIDELDAAGRQRGAGVGGGNDEREQTLNEMLVQIDGFSPTEGIVVIAATNRPDILDPALVRAGRFDRHVTVERPDLAARRAILELHASTRRLADATTELPQVARRTAGFSGADLANVVNEAALLAVRERASAVGHHHLEEAVERVMAGPKRPAQVLSAADKRRISYHEAGHAVVAAAVGQADALEKVSVVARGSGVGHLAVLGEEKAVLTRPEMESRIAVTMAGIAAEELVFGHPSTGSEQDLGRATDIARDMAGRYGMSARLGRMRVLHEHREVFLGRDYLSTRDVSQPTMEHLDAEIRRILDEQEAAAAAILVANRAVLDATAAALVDHETLQRPELTGLLGRVAPFVSPSEVARNGRAPRPRRTVAPKEPAS